MSTNVQIKEVQAFLKWMERKFSLNLIAEKAKRRFVKRGQVYECELGVELAGDAESKTLCYYSKQHW